MGLIRSDSLKTAATHKAKTIKKHPVIKKRLAITKRPAVGQKAATNKKPKETPPTAEDLIGTRFKDFQFEVINDFGDDKFEDKYRKNKRFWRLSEVVGKGELTFLYFIDGCPHPTKYKSGHHLRRCPFLSSRATTFAIGELITIATDNVKFDEERTATFVLIHTGGIEQARECEKQMARAKYESFWENTEAEEIMESYQEWGGLGQIVKGAINNDVAKERYGAKSFPHKVVIGRDKCICKVGDFNPFHLRELDDLERAYCLGL